MGPRSGVWLALASIFVCLDVAIALWRYFLAGAASGATNSLDSLFWFAFAPFTLVLFFAFGFKSYSEFVERRSREKGQSAEKLAREQALQLKREKEERVREEELARQRQKEEEERRVATVRQKVENYMKAGRYEDAALLYEQLGEWEKAGEARKMARTSYVIAADVHLGEDGLSVKCPYCGSAEPLESKTSEVTCKHCGKKYFVPKKILDMM